MLHWSQENLSSRQQFPVDWLALSVFVLFAGPGNGIQTFHVLGQHCTTEIHHWPLPLPGLCYFLDYIMIDQNSRTSLVLDSEFEASLKYMRPSLIKQKEVEGGRLTED